MRIAARTPPPLVSIHKSLGTNQNSFEEPGCVCICGGWAGQIPFPWGGQRQGWGVGALNPPGDKGLASLPLPPLHKEPQAAKGCALNFEGHQRSDQHLNIFNGSSETSTFDRSATRGG